jgi:hypothetical protein
MPNDDPQLRASDDDRDRTASLLREHHAAGRLNVDEFQERLDATYEAKTIGQLQELLADLPSIDLYHLPEQSMRRNQQVTTSPSAVPAEHHSRLSAAWRHHWASWVSVNLLLFVIWGIGAVTSHNLQGLWFLWVAGPWGAILLSRWLFGQHPGGHHPGGGPGPGGQIGGLPGDARAQLEDHKDRMEQSFEEHRQRLDEHLQRHQDRVQEHMQRRQEHLERQQDRLQRRQDRMRRPGES